MHSVKGKQGTVYSKPRKAGSNRCVWGVKSPRKKGRGIHMCWIIFLTHKPKFAKGTEFSQQTLVHKSLYLWNVMV